MPTYFVTSWAGQLPVNIWSTQIRTQFKSYLKCFVHRVEVPYMLNKAYLRQATVSDGPLNIQLCE